MWGARAEERLPEREAGSEPGIEMEPKRKAGSVAGLEMEHARKAGSVTGLEMEHARKAGSVAGLEMEHAQQLRSVTRVKKEHARKVGSEPGVEKVHVQRPPRFGEVSILYVESIEEEGTCLRRISFFVNRELKIFGVRVNCFFPHSLQKITEIMIGIIQLAFGLPLNFVESYIFAVLVGIPWWTGIWYIISGSLVVDIINTSNTHLKQVILLMHVISIIAAVIGGGAYFVSLYMMPPLKKNFFILSPLLLLFFLMMLCAMEFVIAFLVLFLHGSLLVHDFQVASSHSHSISQN